MVTINENGTEYDTDRLHALADHDDHRCPPWSLTVVGHSEAGPSFATWRAVVRILDLFPAVPYLTVQTSGGPLHVGRDFPSGHTEDVDRLLAGIFEADPSVTGIVFPERKGVPEHRATADDPFWSSNGKPTKRVLDMLKAGEIGSEEATDRLKAIFTGER